MNILLIHQVFVSPAEAGGTRHYELAKRCISAGHTFTIVASDLSYLSGKKVEGARGIVSEHDVSGVRVLRAYTHPTLHKSFVWRVVSFLSFMCTSVVAGLRAGKVDLVIGTSPPIFQAASAWLISALRGKPFLLEIRDLWPEFAIDMGVLKNPILIALSRWLESFLYWRADHLLVNSPAYRDYLLARGIRPEKVSFIANGVDPDMFNPAETGDAFRQEFNLHGKFVLMYAGAMGMANDLETVLRAAKVLQEHPEIQVVFVGDGKERPNLEKTAAAMQLKNVTFVGSRPKGQMTNILAAANVFVATLKNIPMFKTTYPNKIFDYMAAGRPTILAIDGVIRDVIEKAQGGVFVQPGDSDALAAAAEEMLRTRANLAETGSRARAYVIQHFNRNNQAEQFVALVEAVAQNRKAA